MKQKGLTEDELLKDMREYAKKHDIFEEPAGTFLKGGKDAAALILIFAIRYSKRNPTFLDYLESWPADVNGELMDCKQEYHECMERYGA